MSRSVREVDVDEVRSRMGGQDQVIVPGERRYYTAEVRAGKVWHTEHMDDSKGQSIYTQSVQVDYLVGSGTRAIAYLCGRDDLLFVSPLNWYQEASKFDFAPGHSAEDARRFGRRVSEDCISCHVGRVNQQSRNTAAYGQPPFHQAAIGCENCHGPGQQHVSLFANKSVNSLGGERDSKIVNPATLDHQRREAVCMQCHLHASARLLRPGRSHFDFRPGDRLDDIWAMLLVDETDSNGEKIPPVNQAQQMLASQCYQMSDGQLGCTSCHDPHSKPSIEQRVPFYKFACLKCHEVERCDAPQVERQRVGDSCIECHMPARDTTRVSHVSQTDHRILRKPTESPQPTGGDLKKASVSMPQLSFLWDSAQRLPEWETKRALGMGLWIAESHGNSQPPVEIIDILGPLFVQHPEDGAMATVLGAFWSQYQSPQRARKYFEAAVADPNVRETALSNLLNAYYVSSEWKRALDVSEEMLVIDPMNPRVHAIRADIFSHFEQLEHAYESAERALELDPTLIPVRKWLIRLYQQTGQDQRMEHHQEILERMLGE